MQTSPMKHLYNTHSASRRSSSRRSISSAQQHTPTAALRKTPTVRTSVIKQGDAKCFSSQKSKSSISTPSSSVSSEAANGRSALQWSLPPLPSQVPATSADCANNHTNSNKQQQLMMTSPFISRAAASRSTSADHVRASLDTSFVTSITTHAEDEEDGSEGAFLSMPSRGHSSTNTDASPSHRTCSTSVDCSMFSSPINSVSVSSSRKIRLEPNMESTYVTLRPKGGVKGVIRSPEYRNPRKPHEPLPLNVTPGYFPDEVVFAVRCGVAMLKAANTSQMMENPTLFQCGDDFLSAGPNPKDPVLLRPLSKASASPKLSTPTVNPLTNQLHLTEDDGDEFSGAVDGCCVMSRVWDVKYEGRGTVGLRSAAHPNYWLARDPVTNTLRLLPEEARTDHSRFKLYCMM